uniref:Uncharacterized protein n=1 Tax=Oryza sativa subsp. japonica TaxID=39947 RepID=Q5Z6L8_ORYSJ|nr:hypothetical protein [Oryza sativa Japonica Group]
MGLLVGWAGLRSSGARAIIGKVRCPYKKCSAAFSAASTWGSSWASSVSSLPLVLGLARRPLIDGGWGNISGSGPRELLVGWPNASWPASWQCWRATFFF